MRHVFTAAQQRTLACVLDALIPPEPESGMPGAGELGLVAAIAEAVERAPDLEPAVAQGLAALDGLAAGRGAEGFADLPSDERGALLNEVAASQPAFLPGLVFHAYVGYYQQPRVLVALGLEGRPPHPRGYRIEPTDWSLLEPVRRQPARYRQT